MSNRRSSIASEASILSAHEYDSDYVLSESEGDYESGVAHRPVTRSMTSKTASRREATYARNVAAILASVSSRSVRHHKNVAAATGGAGSNERRVTRSMTSVSSRK